MKIYALHAKLCAAAADALLTGDNGEECQFNWGGRGAAPAPDFQTEKVNPAGISSTTNRRQTNACDTK